MTLIEYMRERLNYLKLKWEFVTGTYVPLNTKEKK